MNPPPIVVEGGREQTQKALQRESKISLVVVKIREFEMASAHNDLRQKNNLLGTHCLLQTMMIAHGSVVEGVKR